jgi:hypothetical protein
MPRQRSAAPEVAKPAIADMADGRSSYGTDRNSGAGPKWFMILQQGVLRETESDA